MPLAFGVGVGFSFGAAALRAPQRHGDRFTAACVRMAGQWSGGAKKARAPRTSGGGGGNHGARHEFRGRRDQTNEEVPLDEWAASGVSDASAGDDDSFESEWAFGSDDVGGKRQPSQQRLRDRNEGRSRDRNEGRSRDRNEGRSREFAGRGRGRPGGSQRGEFGGYGRGPYQRDARDARVRDEPPTELQELKRSGKDFVYGVSPVLSALTAGRRNMYTLHMQDSINMSARKDRTAIEKIQALAEETEVPIKKTDKGTLNVLSDSRPHQGFVLESDPVEYTPKDRMHPPPDHDTNSECWLVLDEIHDPQNLGALIRTAYFLGVTGVVACSKNSSTLSPVVSKASAGSMELMEIYAAPSLPRFLHAARDSGWRIIGAAMNESATPCKTIVMDKPTLLVLGNEGRGLRSLVRDACTDTVRIGGSKQTFVQSEVDSLNVSVAGGVLLHQLLGK